MDGVKHPYQGHYMEPAFLGFASFAIKNLIDKFEAESGKLNLGGSALERAIDDVTGKRGRANHDDTLADRADIPARNQARDNARAGAGGA